jgi:hypothetical protein
VALAAANGTAQKALEHAEGGLDLPALPVFRNGPVVLEQLTEEASRLGAGRVGRPAPLGGDDPQHAELPVEELVMILGVVAGVGQQGLEAMASVGLAAEAVQLEVVGLGASVDHDAEEQVGSNVDDGG